MHPTDKRTQFIELRAQGWSIHKIARTIDVPKSTLADWQKQEQPRIDELKQMADEAREEEMLENMQRDHEKVSARLALVERQLDEQLRTKVESLSLMELCRLSSALRSQLHKSKSGHFRTKPDASKAPDVRETASDTKTEQIGTTSAENGTSLPMPIILRHETLTPRTAPQQETGHFRTKPDAPKASDVRESVPDTKTEQNGTTSTQNGTSLPMPIILKHETMKPETRHQLPPKPPAPPERMIGHKIDPSKIVGRKILSSAS